MNADLNELTPLRRNGTLRNLMPSDSLATSIDGSSPLPSLNRGRSRIDSDYLNMMVKRFKTKVIFDGDELVETVDNSSASNHE